MSINLKVPKIQTVLITVGLPPNGKPFEAFFSRSPGGTVVLLYMDDGSAFVTTMRPMTSMRPLAESIGPLAESISSLPESVLPLAKYSVSFVQGDRSKVARF